MNPLGSLGPPRPPHANRWPEISQRGTPNQNHTLNPGVNLEMNFGLDTQHLLQISCYEDRCV